MLWLFVLHMIHVAIGGSMYQVPRYAFHFSFLANLRFSFPCCWSLRCGGCGTTAEFRGCRCRNYGDGTAEPNRPTTVMQVSVTLRCHICIHKVISLQPASLPSQRKCSTPCVVISWLLQRSRAVLNVGVSPPIPPTCFSLFPVYFSFFFFSLRIFRFFTN